MMVLILSTAPCIAVVFSLLLRSTLQRHTPLSRSSKALADFTRCLS